MRAEARRVERPVEWVVETPAGEPDAVVAVQPVPERDSRDTDFGDIFDGPQVPDDGPDAWDPPLESLGDEGVSFDENGPHARPYVVPGWPRAADDAGLVEERIPYPQRRRKVVKPKRKPRVSVAMRVGLRVAIAAWLGVAGLVGFAYLQKLPPRAGAVATGAPAEIDVPVAVAAVPGVPEPLIPFE